MSFSLGDDLSLAIKMANAADAITLSRYQAIDLKVDTKPDRTPGKDDIY